MKGFSIAVNAWGLHAILYKGFTDADPMAWLSALGDAAKSLDRRGHGWGLFLDLRDLGPGALTAAQAQALCALLGKTNPGRSAVIAAGGATALRTAARKTGSLAGLRLLTSDGRDRFTIAAAYGWILNARDPDATARSRTGGEVIPFTDRRPVLPGARGVADLEGRPRALAG